MFIGHFAVGFASKRLAPRTSLAALVVAPLLLDVLWPFFLLAGIETVRIEPGNTVVTPLDLHDYPWSHSLVMAVVWSVLAAGAWFFWKKDRTAALVLGAGVFSHWILDFVTHRPDMPLWPGSATSVGLGLWNSLAGTLAVEVSMFVAGVWSYATFTKGVNKKGTIGLCAFLAILVLMYCGAVFGPPPPSVNAIIGSTFGLFVLIPWMWSIDRNRDVVTK